MMDAVNEGNPGASVAESRRRLGELNELAVRYCGAGRFAEAVPLFEDVVAGCRHALGDDDPDTLVSEGNLVVTLLRLNPAGPALGILDEHVRTRSRVLGPRHPATLDARNAQAAARSAAGRLDESVQMFAMVLAERTAVLGAGHPDTLATRLGLGLASAAAGDLPAAVRELREALHDSDRELGPDHRLGQLLRADLAELSAEAGGPDGRPGEGDAPGAEPDHPVPALPVPRRPRGARFPRVLPAQRSADPPAEPEPEPDRGIRGSGHRRPRGARFRRER